jgi:hypothetical protein
MENSIREKGSGTDQQTGYSANLQFVDGILKWLASLIKLTEEEQRDAGIDLGDNNRISP